MTERLSSDEICSRGQHLYEKSIRPLVETTHNGEFLVLDLQSGEYEIDKDEVAASDRATAKHPTGRFYILRIGAPAAHRLGTHYRPSTG